MIPKPEAKTILDAIQKSSVSLIPGVPTLFNSLINYPDIKKYDLSSVKGCFFSGRPIASRDHSRIQSADGHSPYPRPTV